MTYSKPEILDLGSASQIIQTCPKANSSADADCTGNTAAYDLDE
jgi:hypothetical protein